MNSHSQQQWPLLLPHWQRRLCCRQHWFVCLSVCQQHYSKSYELAAMKFYMGVRINERNKWFASQFSLGRDLCSLSGWNMTVCRYLAKEHHWLAVWMNRESGQYGDNEQPWLRRSVLSECSCYHWNCWVPAVVSWAFLYCVHLNRHSNDMPNNNTEHWTLITSNWPWLLAWHKKWFMSCTSFSGFHPSQRQIAFSFSSIDIDFPPPPPPAPFYIQRQIWCWPLIFLFLFPCWDFPALDWNMYNCTITDVFLSFMQYGKLV